MTAEPGTIEYTPRAFTLEDARKLTILRAYVVLIEKKTTELCVSDKDGNTDPTLFNNIVDRIRTLIAQVDQLAEEQGAKNIKSASVSRNTGECYPGYDLCDDGICRVWCS